MKKTSVEPTKTLTPVPNELDSIWDRFLNWNWNLPSMFENRLPATFRTHRMPAMNVYEDEKVYAVTLELPGLDEEDFEIKLMGDQLVITGERKWKEEKKDKEYHSIESQYGSFQRVFTLPPDAMKDSDVIEAEYERGMLEIKIPKVEPTPARRIKIHGKKK